MRDLFPRLVAAAAVAFILIVMASSVRAEEQATGRKVPESLAAPKAAQTQLTYVTEYRCVGGRCCSYLVPVMVPVGNSAEPPQAVNCTCANCPAGGMCNAGQCGLGGCGRFQGPVVSAIQHRRSVPFMQRGPLRRGLGNLFCH